MNRNFWVGGAAVVLLAGSFSVGQFAVNPQVNEQVGPIYPPNPQYNFYSHGGDGDPFQFNWASGHWDYVPIPWNNERPWMTHVPQQPYVWNPNRPEYTVVQNPGQPGVGAVPANQPVNPQQYAPDDTGLWNPPTTRPDDHVGTQIVQFTGRIVGIKAMSLGGVPYPHLFLRLRNANGANGTVDAGEKLEFPDVASPDDLQVCVTGKLGTVDANLVLFADSVKFGSHDCEVKRQGGNQVNDAQPH
jgi:hypothetical protein